MTDLPPSSPPPAGGGESMAEVPALADLGPRVLAFLIDWVGAYLVLFAGLTALAAVLGVVSDALGALVTLLGFVAYAAYWFWQVYQEGTTGQTLGKRQQRIKLVGLENGGQPVGFPLAFVRNLVNGVCGLFWLLAFVDAQRQTLGDKLAKSVVVPA